MNLYEVVYEDGHHCGEDDSDAIYLVRAPDFGKAVELVSNYASPKYHEGQSRPIFPHVIFEIGKDLSLHHWADPAVLRGPYFQCAYNHGWRAWRRKMKGPELTPEWEEET